ncbi:MAG: adenylate/guanylate cyclase domain-containing protein [Bacteroidetes bacterium]|nr:adenylate/guanylate cyclase domain-containing protein [Bacteroidota bacterium]
MSLIISNTLNSQISKILWITVGWTFISVFYVLIAYAGLFDLERDVSDIDLWLYIKGNLMTGILGGIIGGSVVVFFWEKWLRTKKYGSSLWNILWTYTIINFIVEIPGGLFVGSSELGLPFYHARVWQSVLSKIISMPWLVSYLFWLFVVLGTLIILLVNDKYGPGVFRDFLLGKYFHPKREERIFMFLDLRSSTTIAEKLGEQRYFNFLKDIFQHSTASILDAKGEIYQYVGDEIVISWKMHEGVDNANCLNCFFEIQEALKIKTSYYKETYDGIVPEFKAGLHYGYVMAGEIGVVKRDIVFSGDVLNTAARIQQKCNELGVNILLSNYLLDKLNLQTDTFEPKKIGEMELRGKEQKVMLYTL